MEKHLLNCTPNDLFEWREDKTVIPEGHALRSLKGLNNHLALRDIPADKLEKLGEMLAELRKGDDETDVSGSASNPI